MSVGVTGTNGKTSTTTYVAEVLSRLSVPVARSITLGLYLAHERLSVPTTYQGFIETMRRCVEAGGRFAAVEVTSEALAHGFIKAWPCQIGVFTNLTRDHLDSHGSAEHYLASKAQLFMQLPVSGGAVLNGCDPAASLLEEVIPKGVPVLRYGSKSRGVPYAPLHLEAEEIAVGWEGTRVKVKGRDLGVTLPSEVTVKAIGEVFAENALAALAASLHVGVGIDMAVDALSNAPTPSGRFEVITDEPRVVVDYAHTPDALRRTLQTARKLCEGKLTVVCGAGGNRDQAKRPMIGEAASEADRIVLTSDNPRDEDPAEIVRAIRAGVRPNAAVDEHLDREGAIRLAVTEAGAKDVVVVAGKGHEVDQTVGQERRRFSDAEVVRDVLGGRNAGSLSTQTR